MNVDVCARSWYFIRLLLKGLWRFGFCLPVGAGMLRAVTRRQLAAIITALCSALLAIACSSGGGEVAEEKPAAPAATATTAAASGDASAKGRAGIPPAPHANTQAAYIAALKNIDPDIVGDKDPKIIVDRGRSQCAAISNFPNDRAKLLEQTNTRFSAPGRPKGFGLQAAAKILDVVHQHLCPTYPMATA